MGDHVICGVGMNREVRKYITKLKKMSHEEIEKELNNLIDQGKCYWDGYYRDCPLLEWYVGDLK